MCFPCPTINVSTISTFTFIKSFHSFIHHVVHTRQHGTYPGYSLGFGHPGTTAGDNSRTCANYEGVNAVSPVYNYISGRNEILTSCHSSESVIGLIRGQSSIHGKYPSLSQLNAIFVITTLTVGTSPPISLLAASDVKPGASRRDIESLSSQTLIGTAQPHIPEWNPDTSKSKYINQMQHISSHITPNTRMGSRYLKVHQFDAAHLLRYHTTYRNGIQIPQSTSIRCSTSPSISHHIPEWDPDNSKYINQMQHISSHTTARCLRRGTWS